jgi:hypothetical protein
MRRLLSPEPDEEWACTWCYARATVWTCSRDVTGPRYAPANTRWERADGDGLPSGLDHAYGYFGATLCGRYREGVTASPYPWVPEWADACPACKEAAAVIDERWPVEKRGGNRVRIPPSPDSDAPPF